MDYSYLKQNKYFKNAGIYAYLLKKMYTSCQLIFQSIKLAFTYLPKRPFKDCFTNLANFSSQKATSSVKGDDSGGGGYDTDTDLYFYFKHL